MSLPSTARPGGPARRSDVGDVARRRLFVMRVLVISLVVTLGGRLWYVQLATGQHYRKIATDNQVRDITTPAARGEILDDVGRPLVRNETALVIKVSRSELQQQRDHGKAVLARLAAVTGQSVEDLKARIRPCDKTVPPGEPCWNGAPYQPVPVLARAAPQQALMITEHQEDFGGVTAGLEAVRSYPAGTLAAHSLGYLSPVSAQDKKNPALAGLADADLIGRTGLEATYDAALRGTDGDHKVAVDHLGHVLGVLGDTPPQAGQHVVLSLDEGVQSALEQALVAAMAAAHRAGFPAPNASGVVLDARTGHVVALGNVPSYDPGLFVGGISSAAYKQLQDPQNGTPLFNRAVSGTYAPGSTFKIISTATALSDGQAGPGTIIPCPPSFQVGNQSFRNFEGESFGAMNLSRALQVSCDTVFYKLSYDAWVGDTNKLRAKGSADETFAKMARAFGLGSATGIDLTEDTKGSIFDRQAKLTYWQNNKKEFCQGAITQPAGSQRQLLDKENCTDGYVYRGGDAVQFAIGQGDVLVSPLQLAIAYDAIANGGSVISPRLAKAVIDADGKLVRTVDAPVRSHLPVGADTLAYIRDALASVVTGGTARGAFSGFPLGQVPVAGKTGTAQTNDGDTSWFASFAPVTNPQYVVVVDVPQSGQGALFAAPAVRSVYDAIYGFGGKPALMPGGVPPTTLPGVSPDGTVGTPSAPIPPAAGGVTITAAAPPVLAPAPVPLAATPVTPGGAALSGLSGAGMLVVPALRRRRRHRRGR